MAVTYTQMSNLVWCCCTNAAKSRWLRCIVVDSRHTCWTDANVNTALLV